MPTRKLLIFITLLLSLSLAACGGTKPQPTPTLSVAEIQAQAIATFAIGLTQTALAAPTATPTATVTPSPTPFNTLPVGSPVAVATTAIAGNPTTSCYGLTFVKDVTIPDDTVMTPGQAFTKTWLVQNSGSCAWEAGFKFAFTGGDAMGGQTFTLPKAVAPGAQLEISIPMVAPTNKTGTVRGNWRMSTATGTFFGDEVFVQIVVGTTAATPTATGATSNTSTPTATFTSTPTLTPTP